MFLFLSGAKKKRFLFWQKNVERDLADKLIEMELRIEKRLLKNPDDIKSENFWREIQSEEFLDAVIKRIKRKQL